MKRLHCGILGMATAGQHHNLYGARWRKARAEHLAKHPLCKDHAERGVVVEARVVDHIQPHKGDLVLFWSRANWQSLCTSCHNAHKQRVERNEVLSTCNLAGMPTDPAHPWST